MEKHKVEEMCKLFGDIFWRHLDQQLEELSKKEGSHNSIEQQRLRAIVILHLRVEQLEKELKLIHKSHSKGKKEE